MHNLFMGLREALRRIMRKDAELDEEFVKAHRKAGTPEKEIKDELRKRRRTRFSEARRILTPVRQREAQERRKKESEARMKKFGMLKEKKK